MISKIEEDIIQALREKDKDRLTVLRSLKSAVQYQQIELGRELEEKEIIAVLAGQVKSRQQAIELYLRGNRPELAEKETREIEIINFYLPQKMPEAEIEVEVNKAITELNASSMKDMGLVMKAMKEKLGNRIDGKKLSEIVRNKLQG
ncbi:MAG: GatB/YqeY domain-containing protein [Candidatus Cloacimonetes bacterium]|nr:GatB/YqeY domain-containing protein [Candidatus Cloacimonadota bacterium]MBL7148911.1 GatB/YqeY domain-containing protein [Candidatus Cloacimonadota bacterium]